MVTKDKQGWAFEILRLSTHYNGYKPLKICLKLQIPYYHPLNQWLLGATNARINKDGPLKFLDYQPTNGYKPLKLWTKSMVVRGNQW